MNCNNPPTQTGDAFSLNVAIYYPNPMIVILSFHDRVLYGRNSNNSKSPIQRLDGYMEEPRPKVLVNSSGNLVTPQNNNLHIHVRSSRASEL